MLRIGDLANKAILITGASSGIGAAMGRAFAEHGARVGVHWSINENSARAGGAGQTIHVNSGR